MGEIRNSHNIFVGKPEGLRKFGRYRLRLEDTIKWILKKIWYKSSDWIHLDQNRG
jgi:hypothetical protein